MTYVDQLELILNPKVLNGFRQAVWDARTEMAQDAKNLVFNQEMQELQPFLELYRNAISRYTSGGYQSQRQLWHMRPLLKKIIELYGKPSNNIPENQ